MPDDLFGDAPPDPRVRSRPPSDKDAVGSQQRVRAVAANPDVYALAASLPPTPKRKDGQPADFPDYVYLIYAALISVFGAARGTATEIVQSSWVWDEVRAGVAAVLGVEESERLRLAGPQRHHWTYNSKRLRRYVPQLQRTLEERAVQQAVEQGLLDPDAPRAWSDPSRAQIVYGDGTVMKPALQHRDAESVNPETGEIRRHRVDPASGWHTEAGDKKTSWGPKLVLLHAGNEDYQGRVLLAFRHQADRGGRHEADCALEMLDDLFERAPGALGACWDGLLRAVHHDHIAAHGRLSINRVHGAPDKRNSKTKDKTHVLPALTHPLADGSSCEHDLWAVNGRVHERIVTDDGQATFEAVPVTRLMRREDRQGGRWYHVLRVACPDAPGGVLHRNVRIDGIAVLDEKRRFTRQEYLRQIPPGTRVFVDVASYRPGAESINAALDSRYPHRRMPAYGVEQQSLIMIGFFLAQNGSAVSCTGDEDRPHRPSPPEPTPTSHLTRPEAGGSLPVVCWSS